MFAAHAAFQAGGAPAVVTFDAVGPGRSTTSAGTFTFTHTATAGSAVIVGGGAYSSNNIISSVTYGGTAMNYLGHSGNGGDLSLYYLNNAPGGAQTVSFSTPDQCVVNAISFTGVKSIVGPTFSSGSGSGSQSPTCSPGEMILESFGWYVYPNTVTGGTLAYNYNNYQNNYNYGGLAYAYSPTSTTFSWTSGWPSNMGYLILKPT